MSKETPSVMGYIKKMFLFACLIVVFLVVVVYHQRILFTTHSIGRSILKNIGKLSLSWKDNTKNADLWYNPANPEDDRISSQMNHMPKHYKQLLEKGIQPKWKRILRYYGFRGHPFYGGRVVPGKKTFENCPVNRCEVFSKKTRILEMDAVVFEYGHPKRTWKEFPSRQIWVMYKSESPYLSWGLKPKDEMNWTASYRRDSTLTVPIYKFIRNDSFPKPTNNKNYAKGKTKKVAIFTSNCRPSNNRLRYTHELSKYISVDIYGRCGNKTCVKRQPQECRNMLHRDYKFYLAFENANCRHYITEKLFKNALQLYHLMGSKTTRLDGQERLWGKQRSDTLPIVMGAPPFDYKMVAPPNSFIHVDDFHSPKELAEYLHKLDKNDTLYNEYFKWKGTGIIIHTYQTNFWCRFCSLLHEQDERQPSWYTDVSEWWRRGKDICIGSDYWRNHPGSNTSLKMAPAVIP